MKFDFIKKTIMSRKRFEEKIEKLRCPERMAQLEVSRVVDLISEIQHQKRLLDIGTGSALFAEFFFHTGQMVIGIDSDPEMITAAHHYLPQVALLIANAENLPFSTDSFETSFMGMVLHEIQNPVAALAEAKRVTRELLAVLEWPPPIESDPVPHAPRFFPDEVANMA
ncbi:MAG: class I SAM-dependent methyltransferase, partial [Desulfobacterales bacterium]